MTDDKPIADRISFEELRKMAENYVAYRSRGYVSDGMEFARWILSDGQALVDNLTATQTRYTELLEENRRLQGILNREGTP